MSCLNCDTAQLLDENKLELVRYTYVRVGRANVLISGCDEHLRELLKKYNRPTNTDIDKCFNGKGKKEIEQYVKSAQAQLLRELIEDKELWYIAVPIDRIPINAEWVVRKAVLERKLAEIEGSDD